EVVERMLHRLPAPPAGPAGRPAMLEVGAPHRPVDPDRCGGRLQHPPVLPEPPGPAGVAHAVVEHGPPPPGPEGGRHETGGGGPVREEETAAIDEPVEPAAVVGAEPAPEGQVVGAVEHVDRVELEAARVLDETDQSLRCQGACPRLPEMLTL